MEQGTYQRAKNFIYRNARPIDMARWQYHFDGGSRANILNILSYYQNEDGGFGHALEPDCWNPYSAPVQTIIAIEILNEIGFYNKEHPVVLRILSYIDKNIKQFGHLGFDPMSNNDYPHARWWSVKEEDSEFSSVHTQSPPLIGFVLLNADKSSELYEVNCKMAIKAYEDYINQEDRQLCHYLLDYVKLMEYLELANVNELIDMDVFKDVLKKDVSNAIINDCNEWRMNYDRKPSFYHCLPDSIFYEDNKEVSRLECDYIINSQLNDGSWYIPWDWGDYINECAISKNWWKSDKIIRNMLYLKAFEKLER